MSAMKRYKTEIAVALFWLLNAVNTVYVSRSIGYFPKRLREQAQMLADTQPYPWTSILFAWFVMAVATVGIYLILRKTTSKVLSLLIYSIALLGLTTIFIPTDVGGVAYALMGYTIYTFLMSLIALVWGAFSLARKRKGNTTAL